MNESQVHDFWERHPCGDDQVGGLLKYRKDYEAFFSVYDRHRYSKESHILPCLDGIDFSGKNVLEIGLGQGAESEQIIRRGGLWSGLELTAESVSRVRARLQLRDLPYREIKQGSVLRIPYEDESFDMVFTHGVLHHVPDIRRAQREIRRVLKPQGELVAMLYSKWSLNYLVSIGIVRRLMLLFQYTTDRKLEGKPAMHLANARKTGLLPYLRMKNYIHRNTDGPLNPYSKVYDMRIVKQDFPDFRVCRAYKRFMHAPPLKVSRLPLQHLLGWHLWVHLKPVEKLSGQLI
ncbi:MAG: class I SAM-dependent methyltransferase [Syntrophobacteraceae bacterium]